MEKVTVGDRALLGATHLAHEGLLTRALFAGTRQARRRQQDRRVHAGIDVERDVIAQMGFRPVVSGALKTMDPRIFRPGLMGLAADIHAKPRTHRSARVARWHAQRG